MRDTSEPEDVIKAEMGPKEDFLWAGRPRRGIVLRPADAFLIPFTILWCGIPTFIAVVIILSDTPLLVLVLTPFVLIGLYFVFGRFFVDARRRGKTYYGVSTERIIIISGLFVRKVNTWNLETLTDISMNERSNGSGMITFGPTFPWYNWFGGAGWPGPDSFAPPRFEMLDDVKNVYELIREAQHASKQRP